MPLLIGAVTEIFGSLFTEKKHMVRIVGGLTMTDHVRNDLRAKGKAHKHSPNADIFYYGTPPSSMLNDTCIHEHAQVMSTSMSI